ncbi:MAG: type IV pilin N-terminal domain-containing protein [Methanomicrobium sp.]|nr:type IV pilin N-terminal domain-containing protein [Methanomicrobium sp.]
MKAREKGVYSMGAILRNNLCNLKNNLNNAGNFRGAGAGYAGNGRAGCRGAGDETGIEAISPVIGEMLMLTVVIILVALFAASTSSFIPADRDPTINVLVGDVSADNHNVTLWHKGGDVVPMSSMKVIIGNGKERKTFMDGNFVINGNTDLRNFRPGDSMVVSTGDDIRGEDITVVVGNTVVMYGRIKE